MGEHATGQELQRICETFSSEFQVNVQFSCLVMLWSEDFCAMMVALISHDTEQASLCSGRRKARFIKLVLRLIKINKFFLFSFSTNMRITAGNQSKHGFCNFFPLNLCNVLCNSVCQRRKQSVACLMLHQPLLEQLLCRKNNRKTAKHGL